jgi:predicted hotdog family 3-hydroxylacyl-ACP dehydratase
MSFPEITEFVPHRGSALLLDRIERWDESRVVCTVTIRDDHPYLSEGKVPAVVGLELMAQAVAAYVGMIRKAEGASPRVGYLVGVRRADFHLDHHELSELLRVTATATWVNERAGTFECSIEGARGRVSDATLSVYETHTAELEG